MSLDISKKKHSYDTLCISHQRTTTTACHLFCSTTELILLVLELAPIQTVINCQRVCKTWHSIIGDSTNLEHRLQHRKNDLALSGKQELVLRRRFAALKAHRQDCKPGLPSCETCQPVTVDVVLAGAAGVGRKALIRRLAYNTFEDGNNARWYRHDYRDYFLLGECIRPSLWDMNSFFRGRSRTRYSSPVVASEHIALPEVALLVYSVTDCASFEEAEEFYRRSMGRKRRPTFWIVVANKTDMPPSDWQVSAEEGGHFAESLDAPFLEVSARSGAGIDQDLVHQMVGRALYDNWIPRAQDGDRNKTQESTKPSRIGAALTSLKVFLRYM